MVIEMTVSQARATLSAATTRAEYRGETTYLTKHGRRAAAIVPADSAELLEALEDILDENAVSVALDALNTGKDDVVPFVRRAPRRTA